MKNGMWIIALVFLMAAGGQAFVTPSETGFPPDVGGPQEYRQEYRANTGQEYGADMDYIYNYLAPYGNWINLYPFGYVWTPRYMGYQWRPYTNGHWIMTDYGWTWIANEQWGSIPFHYGRWGYNDYFGWFWVPGMVWGPAWVSWRWNDQYVGWAPLPPEAEFRRGMDYSSFSFNIPIRFWIFLQVRHFLYRDIYRYTLPYERNAMLINYTSSHNNVFFRDNRIFNEGMGIDVVRRFTGKQVPQYRVMDLQQPGPARIAGNDVRIYRPAFQTVATAAPKNFLSGDEAQRDLAPARIFEPQPQSPLSSQESAVRRRQAEEMTLLKKTQSQELVYRQQMRDAELTQIRDTTEKAKIRQDYQIKMAELQKQHQAEKQQLTERHKQDTEQVKQVIQRAKQQQATRKSKTKGG